MLGVCTRAINREVYGEWDVEGVTGTFVDGSRVRKGDERRSQEVKEQQTAFGSRPVAGEELAKQLKYKRAGGGNKPSKHTATQYSYHPRSDRIGDASPAERRGFIEHQRFLGIVRGLASHGEQVQ